MKYIRILVACLAGLAITMSTITPARAETDSDLSPAETQEVLAIAENYEAGANDKGPMPTGGSYRLSTQKNTREAGYVETSGSLDFRRRGKAVHLYGWLNDHCPGNGKGAYLYLVLTFKDGTKGIRLIRRDVGGCSGDGVTYKALTRGPGGKKIRKALVLLVERDAGHSAAAHAGVVFKR
ncbi:hypothetical protein ACQBAR_09115 [Propionibacteriaceae bacterium Y1685]|uniref:hypothetical protein n=1 Tax=Microlunatus sp. Y1700 TaxID=3418487 RepID=UPI003B78C2B8